LWWSWLVFVVFDDGCFELFVGELGCAIEVRKVWMRRVGRRITAAVHG
jgi:hypothetical protein